MSGVTLLTGFPGFLGRRLAARLLADPSERLIALVHPGMLEAARAAAAAIEAGERLEVLPGDISQARLGLERSAYDRLAAEVTSVFHLAAIYDLAVAEEIAQRVNVDGTGNVLELCSACERLERHNYVSTAYVAGDRHGVVYEHELALGQGFKNHYEATKFQAEVWVRETLGQIPTTIYRPAIVVGDSRSGETQKFDGPYYMLRVVSFAAAHGLPLPQFGRARAPFNVVPVDFVLDALAAGARQPEAAGLTLHLVDPDPVSAADLLTILAREYGDMRPAYRLAPALVETALRSGAVRKLFAGAPRESIGYLNHPVRFDTRNASAVLERAGLRCPRFEEYASPMVEFFKAHEHDPAFAPAAG